MSNEAKKNNKLPQKPVIVVLCAGRSGSSLLMNLLSHLGMTLSKKLLGPHVSNPDGFFEDVDIVELHKQFFLEIGSNSDLPLPDGWHESNAYKKFRPLIRALVKDRISDSKTPWGFKDPRTAITLPLWIEILSSMWIVPRFVLSVRDPSVSIQSFLTQAKDKNPGVAELVWLHRMCNAITLSAGNFFVAHYEDWFANPLVMADQIMHYTGLDSVFRGDLKSVCDHVIKQHLNRSKHTYYSVNNKYITKLYDALRECQGLEFDRSKLMDTVRECNEMLDSFKGWYQVAHQEIAKSKALAEKLQTSRDQEQRIPALENRIADLEAENKRLSSLEFEIVQSGKALEHLSRLFSHDLI